MPLLLIIAVIFGAIAVAIWFFFIRPVPQKSGAGVIQSKGFKPAGEYWQQPAGNRDGFWVPTRIPIAECYVFGILVEGVAGQARVALNTGEAETFSIGQKVRVEYIERGVPLLWKRIYVLEMKHAE